MLWAGILNFKFKIVFWNIFFSEIWRPKKRIALSEKKPPLTELFNSQAILTKVRQNPRKSINDLSVK